MVVNQLFFFHIHSMIINLLIFVRLKQSNKILSDIKLSVYCNILYHNHIDLLMILT